MIEILQAFGIGNIITIILASGGIIFSYATIKSKVYDFGEKLLIESSERKAEDEKIKQESNRYFERNETQYRALLSEIGELRKEMAFHLGYHSSKDED